MLRDANGSALRAALLAAGVVAAVLTGVSRPAQALVIDPLFDSSVTAQQQSVIDTAIGFYEQSFVDPITVYIEFMTTTSGNFAGQSYSTDYRVPYASYASALGLDAYSNSSAIGMDAYASLSHGNTASNVQFSSADGRALGCGGCAPMLAGQGSVSSSTLLDGIVTVNSAYYGDNGAMVLHEVDEVLGIGGGGSVLPSLPATNGSVIGPMDLFRYSGIDTPSLTTSPTAAAYFSLNAGATAIAGFNQSGTGDYGDFTTSSCYVQSASLCGSPTISLTSPEGLALQAIGYDAVPEPAGLAVLGSAVAGLGLALRRRSARGQRAQDRGRLTLGQHRKAGGDRVGEVVRIDQV